jgi:transposase
MMLALAPRPTAVYLCVGPTDMRKGFDGLMRVAAEQATRDVLQGGLFVFVVRRGG